MQTAKKQQGMTLIGWLLILMLIAVIATVGLKLIPVYLDGYKVYQTLSSIAEDSSSGSKSVKELRTMIDRRFDINMVNDASPQDVTISKQGGVTVIEVEYEARRQLFGNLYAVVLFEKRVELK
jgi:hypothetical protein